MRPLFVVHFKQGKTVFDKPEKGNAANQNQTSMRRRNRRKIINNVIHDPQIFELIKAFFWFSIKKKRKPNINISDFLFRI